ncbi:MAG: circadian clock protein KaiC [Bdellovibrionales bacterium]
MPSRSLHRSQNIQALKKCPTGITGLDEIALGGLPCSRTTLLCGGAGCGKTLMAVEFVVRGIVERNEPGIFITFEESPDELMENVASLGFDLQTLVSEKKLIIDHIQLKRTYMEEDGEYDLEGLFVRLALAIDTIRAKRVAIDTIETLFGAFKNETILRSEINRLFDWLKDKGVTSVVTGEKGQGTLTRYGLEEYISDCVIFLDHRVEEGITTRRLRIVKYRGSIHGTNEYPFLIDRTGIAVMPITSIGLNHQASTERISSGIPKLDEMLGGPGYYRGSSVLISGLAGTGKTTFSAHFSAATCRRGEKSLYFGFEESQSQFARNMRSVGLDFDPWIQKGVFRYEASRPTLYGLESHLVAMYRQIELFSPCTVVMDPLSTFLGSGTSRDVKSMLMRLIDFLKNHQITAIFTSLLHNEHQLESTDVGVSSLMDSWLLLRTFEIGGERNRGLNILKSRGMNHSNQVREFRFSESGVDLIDVYVGPQGVLTGSARVVQEARDRAAARALEKDRERKRLQLNRKRKAVEAQIAALEAELVAQEQDTENELSTQEFNIASEADACEQAGVIRTHAASPVSADRNLQKH